ncbi:MAG: hypothetical protein JWM99_1633 [Verrucomicrobiales bacterium]|nr:hypothetical protein [Verrucomicrobiales bacterium]
MFDKDTRKHFVGEVEAYENGLVRAIGHVFVIENPTENIFRRKSELRSRIISISAGNVYVNVLPAAVDLEQIHYECNGRGLRITDGSAWHLDLKEFGWA